MIRKTTTKAENLRHSLFADVVSSRLADDQISPLTNNNAHKISRLSSALNGLSLAIVLSFANYQNQKLNNFYQLKVDLQKPHCID